jgi:uncharacterized protein YjbJ (UPF0337 family)
LRFEAGKSYTSIDGVEERGKRKVESMTEKNKGAMDEAKGLVKEKAKHLTKEAAGAIVGNQELAKGLAKEATGAATGDEELKAKGRSEWQKGTQGAKEDLGRIVKESLKGSE